MKQREKGGFAAECLCLYNENRGLQAVQNTSLHTAGATHTHIAVAVITTVTDDSLIRSSMLATSVSFGDVVDRPLHDCVRETHCRESCFVTSGVLHRCDMPFHELFLSRVCSALFDQMAFT